jgi:VCBS repeat-containing protein
MPLPTTHKLFIDVKSGLAYPNFSSTSPVSNPSFYLGDLAKLQVFFIEETGLGTYPRQEVAGLGTPGIRVAVGKIDASPTSGHFTLTFGGDTTNVMDYNTTAAFMETKLNQLASIDAAGDVTVSKIGDNYAIKFNTNGSRAAFTGDAAALIPLSNVGITVLQEGDATHPEIVLVHLQQNVAALATSFSALPASTATISTLSAWDGSRAVYRLAISPDPKAGTFSLAFDADTGTDVSTSSIAVGSTALDVQNALSINALANKVTVQQVGAYAYDIAVTAQPDTGGLTANSSGLLSFTGFEGELDLNTANAISYLDGAESLETTLEVEIADGVDHQTVLQIPCVLKSAVIDEAAVNTVSLDPVLTQATGDGRYLRQANNLSDLASTSTARTNLSVYSKAETDAAIAAGGGGGGIPEAPTDGFGYARQSSGWTYTPTFDSIVLGATSTITFSDASVQTTAAFNNLADHLTPLVFNVTWTGSAWSIDFQPINGFINSRMAANELQIYSASGVDNVSGLSTTTTSTFTTTNAGQFDNLYLRLINAGATYTSTLPINLP